MGRTSNADLSISSQGHQCNLFQLDTVKSSKDLVTAARQFKVHISEPGLGRRESGVFRRLVRDFFRDIFFVTFFSVKCFQGGHALMNQGNFVSMVFEFFGTCSVLPLMY